MRKTYMINFNPDENPNNGLLKWGLLYNPFPKTAICVGPLGDGDPKFRQMTYEMDVEKHLKAGVTPEQAKTLLHGLVSEEVISYVLQNIALGDRIEVIIDSEKMELLKRKLPNPEQIDQQKTDN